MAWWIDKNTDALKKASSSPGADWVQIPGADDSMTEKQAQQQLLNDVAKGTFGKSFGIPPADNPFAGISDIGHALSGIGAFFDDAWKMATNWRMWASLGWLLLGLALIFIGGGLWLNKSLGLTSRIPLVV